MPATTTVTSFVTMVAGTKARASHVNTNFDVLRGHLLPLTTDTATSSNNTHDLGATDHYWRKIYLGQAPFINGSQLGKVGIETFMDGSVPTALLDDNSWLTATTFERSIVSGVRFQFVVPDEYAVGNRISLSLRYFGDTGGSHVNMRTEAALFKPSTTNASLTSPSNVLTTSSDILITTTPAGQINTNTSLRLTSSDGKINSITVTAGDVIAVKLDRIGTATTDTNTGYFFLTNVFVDLNN
jgi:hypothetical protein